MILHGRSPFYFGGIQGGRARKCERGAISHMISLIIRLISHLQGSGLGELKPGFLSMRIGLNRGAQEQPHQVRGPQSV